MRRSIGPGVSLVVVIAALVGCDEGPPPCSAGWLAAGGAVGRPPEPPDFTLTEIPGVPIQAVLGRAPSAHGLIVGGVSAEADLFWDAWVVPFDGGSPRRLAPIGDALVAIDASGALWTTITSEDESGTPAYETRLSPADGSPSVLLSADLPANFRPERAVADDDGRRVLIGTETRDGAARAAVFAVTADGGAARVACDPRADSPLILDAWLAPYALHLLLQYAEGPPTTARIIR